MTNKNEGPNANDNDNDKAPKSTRTKIFMGIAGLNVALAGVNLAANKDPREKIARGLAHSFGAALWGYLAKTSLASDQNAHDLREAKKEIERLKSKQSKGPRK
jgi:hypothetical protein